MGAVIVGLTMAGTVAASLLFLLKRAYNQPRNRYVEDLDEISIRRLPLGFTIQHELSQGSPAAHSTPLLNQCADEREEEKDKENDSDMGEDGTGEILVTEKTDNEFLPKMVNDQDLLIDQLQQRIEDLTKLLSDIQADLTKARLNETKLENQLKIQIQNNAKLKLFLQEAKSEVVIVTNKLEEAKSDNAAMKTKINAVEQNLAEERKNFLVVKEQLSKQKTETEQVKMIDISLEELEDSKVKTKKEEEINSSSLCGSQITSQKKLPGLLAPPSIRLSSSSLSEVDCNEVKRYQDTRPGSTKRKLNVVGVLQEKQGKDVVATPHSRLRSSSSNLALPNGLTPRKSGSKMSYKEKLKHFEKTGLKPC